MWSKSFSTIRGPVHSLLADCSMTALDSMSTKPQFQQTSKLARRSMNDITEDLTTKEVEDFRELGNPSLYFWRVEN